MTHYNQGNDNPMYGRKHSEESRRKMSKSQVGKKRGPLSEEHKKLLSKLMKGRKPTFLGRKHTEKTKKKMIESHKGQKAWNKGISRTEEEKMKISKSLKALNGKHPGAFKKGEKHPGWNGGKSRDANGYICIRVPEHPNSTNKGYVFEHRLVAEKALGRHLNGNEVVHHINGNVADNRNENLLICSRRYHMSFHRKMSNMYMKEKFGGLK